MSQKLKKVPRWLPVALVFLLAVLLLIVWLAADQNEPVVVHSPALDTEPVSKPEASLSVIYEALTEQRKLQAPKDVNTALHNGYPESGIALVIDDVGYDLKALERILALPFPVAISVLPDAPKATEAATMAHESGRVVMLHLPMEPSSPKYRSRMDASFLRMDMNEIQIREHFQLALQRVPFVTGVNNHMGSLLTTLEMPMKWVMEMCKEKSLFFIDSKTSHDSVAASIASEYGLHWGARRIFLDHTVDAEDMKMAWKKAIQCAEQKGSCIVIGHPHAETLNFLEQQVVEKDYHFMRPVTSMLRTGGDS